MRKFIMRFPQLYKIIYGTYPTWSQRIGKVSYKQWKKSAVSISKIARGISTSSQKGK